VVAIKKEAAYRFKADEELFNKWKSFKSRLDLIAAIVQNDHEGTGLDLEGWVKETEIVKMEYDELVLETQKHIASTIKEVSAGNEKYKVIYEDHTADDDIVKVYVTEEEYDNLLKEDGNNITILKYPKIPSK